MEIRRSAKRLYIAVTMVVVALKLNAQRSGNALAGEIVLGGTKPSHEDDDVGATDGGACNSGEMVKVVADNGLEGDDHAQFVELPVRKREFVS